VAEGSRRGPGHRDVPDVDARGFRNRGVSLEDAEVVVVGDSHTYGYNVDVTHAFPFVLGQLTHRRTYAMGIGGYGIYQYLALFHAILARQACLIARWQLVGFIHGVMNTDNMALSGETIDYGPCAFMDTYDPATVFSSIDEGGRYAYGNQPPIAQWNLARLAEAMLPLFDRDIDKAVERATAALDRFPDLFEQHRLDGMRAKLGLFTREPDDEALVSDLLALLGAQRRLHPGLATSRRCRRGRRVRSPSFQDTSQVTAWLEHAGGETGRTRRRQAPGGDAC
jgi:uncharacterized protein YdiU (UPF0061 family)